MDAVAVLGVATPTPYASSSLARNGRLSTHPPALIYAPPTSPLSDLVQLSSRIPRLAPMLPRTSTKPTSSFPT
ncbi:UNVERIFIED_CONTAM: hypothetical protein Sangu_3003500 [Sesamum angustifolium]|uniref:Uncharacterized protein n=1 Tax=Sesamum angustifolium TaxID=2727405 RepID=A0AAW2KM15_9LAMI